jgi:4-hydroxyphenylacetate 3-monooxygenase
MVVRRKSLIAWAEQHHGFLGRSPDHVASALAGQYMGLELFRKHGERYAKAFADYFRYARDNDLFLTYVIINPQADRSKDWGDQPQEHLVATVVDEDHEGITIRGAKMLGTSSIMANEVLVANLQPLKPGEENLAFCCALPLGTDRVRVLSRKSFESAAVSRFDNPMSCCLDENDALFYFDDVKVPWERVFVYRDTDMARAQFHDTPGHVFQNYQSQIRLTVKLRFLVGDMPQVRERLGWLAAKVGMVEAMMHGMEAAGERYGDYYVPNRHMMYSAQVITQDLYPVFINAMRELAGGALIMLPSSERDMQDPALRAIVRKTQISAAATPEERVRFLKMAWDAIGSEFASRHIQYEMFYAGAQFVTCGHSFRTFDWKSAARISDMPLGSVPLPNPPAASS